MVETMVVRIEWWTNYGAIIVTTRDGMSGKSTALSRDLKEHSLESVIAEAMKILTREVMKCPKPINGKGPKVGEK